MILAHHAHLWTGGLKVETDLLSLLPSDERDQAADEVLRHLSDSASRSVVVLITGPTEADSMDAADRFAGALKLDRLQRLAGPRADVSALDELLPFRDRLLTSGQMNRLADAAPEELEQLALMQLQQPMSQRLGEFRDDPLQLFPEFLRERAQSTRVRPKGNHLVVDGSVLLRYQLTGAAFALDGVAHLATAIELAKAGLPANVKVLAAGVPLFAEAAAVQANAEVSTVGFGSLAAIMLIMFFAFRSPRPLLLVVLSVGMGVATGLSVCVLIFGKVHLMTLVFGAGLVGVAEDYGIHYFASRQAQPARDRRELLRHLTPGLFMAMLTSVAGYVMLAIAPMPGLRQVAVFSSGGLAGAFLTVLAWFPYLDRGEVKSTRFATAWAATRSKWPSLSRKALAIGVLVTTVVTFIGVSRLSALDDIRALQSSPPALIDAQRIIAATIGLPSPAQFFIVRGDDEAQRLEREEALTLKLQRLAKEGVLTGHEAVSSWVPSPARQEAQRALFTRTRDAVISRLADELDDAPGPRVESTLLTVDTLLATSLGEALRPLWLKDASVVLVHAPKRDRLDELGALSSLPGVRFVDRTADLSSVMRRWRVGMTELLLAGYTVIFLALFSRFRGRAWRALLPTAVASGLALATVGFLGEPLTLFHVLALWLLLGMGVDYGIFLLEHSADQGEAWLAVGLGAVSTLLSFGLLAVSTTPAIHAFGVTLGVGVTLVWLLSPLSQQKHP
ncbi:MAG: MMPL family transporter [Archangium sp.]|nr:MMPL family transporter [Archangium sp.]MDP3574310.1 MMPL family transporter [Archangium sp.]